MLERKKNYKGVCIQKITLERLKEKNKEQLNKKTCPSTFCKNHHAVSVTTSTCCLFSGDIRKSSTKDNHFLIETEFGSLISHHKEIDLHKQDTTSHFKKKHARRIALLHYTLDKGSNANLHYLIELEVDHAMLSK